MLDGAGDEDEELPVVPDDDAEPSPSPPEAAAVGGGGRGPPPPSSSVASAGKMSTSRLSSSRVAAPVGAPGQRPAAVAAGTGRSSAGGGALGRTRCVVKLLVQRVLPSYSEPWKRSPQKSSSGSGFLIEGRRILTNAHVVERASHVRARKSSCPVMFSCTVEWVSRPLDLALLSVNDEDAFFELTSTSTSGTTTGGAADDAGGGGDAPPSTPSNGTDAAATTSSTTATAATPTAPGPIRHLTLTTDLPRLDENVTCVGFPQGGQQISVTRGVVSRVDVSATAVLRVQIDAAINPGNSGGPVFDEAGRVVGVASSVLKSSSNIGYIIPSSVVSMFLGMCDDGIAAAPSERSVLGTETPGEPRMVPGIASPGITAIQNLESKVLRRRLGLVDEHGGGVRVAGVVPEGSGGSGGDGDGRGQNDDDNGGEGRLFRDDVILTVDGVEIGQDGTVQLSPERSDERIHFTSLFTRHRVGHVVELGILRNGNRLNLRHRLTSYRRLCPYYDGFDAHPSYVMCAGCVFVPLSSPWIGTQVKSNKIPTLFKQYTYKMGRGDEQIIVLSKILADEVNVGYHNMGVYILRSVNGRKPSNLRDLVRLIVSSDGPNLEFRLFKDHQEESEHVVCLDMDEVRDAEDRIMERHMIANWCSADAVPFELRKKGWNKMVTLSKGMRDMQSGPIDL